MLKHCKPDIIVERLEHLDQDDLWERGVRGIILDLDNTLCAWHSSEVSPERMAWLQRAKERFKLCILSNTIKGRRLCRVGDTIGIPRLARWGLGRKPSGGGIRAALKVMGTRAEESAMVGDQVFADVLGGNRCGLLTVWIPVIDSREFISTRLVRLPERWVLRRLGCSIPACPPDRT
jgi:HAD superfamily phosphatase (TIGR01668 family)